MFWFIFVFVSIILFVLGTAIGSFLNVLIYRSVEGESWVRGRSHCESCLKQIAWYDNIPLFSFLMLSGKCRQCRTPIAISHPVIEFLTGSLLVWWWWGGSLFFRLTQHPLQFIQPAFWLIVAMILLIIFFADLRYTIIPDTAVGALLLLTVAYRLYLVLSGVMRVQDFGLTLLGMVVCSGFFFALWYFTKGRGFGFGDVKFAFPYALLLGWPNILVGVFLAFVMGGTVGVFLLLSRKKTLKQTVPFGPFFVLSTVITLVAGSRILEWYLALLR